MTGDELTQQLNDWLCERHGPRVASLGGPAPVSEINTAMTWLCHALANALNRIEALEGKTVPCPECGKPCRRSLHTHLIRCADCVAKGACADE